MIESPGWAFTVISFFLVIGPLIFVHELGHYFVGRWFGVKADIFSIGFGREVAGWTDRRGTRWKLCWLPLGGYVKFAGDMNAASTPSREWLALPAAERAQTFQSKPVWQRFLIVAAGPVTNFLAAVLIFIGLYAAVGVPSTAAIVGGMVADSAAERSGIRTGDRILAIDGDEVEGFADLNQYVALRPGQTVELLIERGGEQLTLVSRIDGDERTDQFGNKARIGSLGLFPMMDSVVGDVMEGSAADRAGLKPGDMILGIDGVPIRSFSALRDYVRVRPSQEIDLAIDRNGQRLTLRTRLGSAVQPAQGGGEVRVGELGVSPAPGKMEKQPFWRLPGLAVRATAGTVEAIVVSLGQLVTAQRSVKELGGPLKIAQISGQQATLGWLNFFEFMALISINLGFINLLPIPLLDGGHLMFYAIEGVRRKPLRPEAQEWAFRAGLAALLTLMIFVTLNDLTSFGLWSRVGGLIG